MALRDIFGNIFKGFGTQTTQPVPTLYGPSVTGGGYQLVPPGSTYSPPALDIPTLYGPSVTGAGYQVNVPGEGIKPYNPPSPPPPPPPPPGPRIDYGFPSAIPQVTLPQVANISDYLESVPPPPGIQQPPGTQQLSGTQQPSATQTPYPQIDYEALIAPALAAYNQAEAAAQGMYDVDVGDIETQLGGQRAREAQYLTGRERTAVGERGRQAALSQQAVNQQRSALVEIRQGLQALYGGTTGTGAFATELAGRATTGNIAQIQTNLSNAMFEIDDKLNQVREVSKIALDEIDKNFFNLKDKAKAELYKNLAQIRMQRGELQATTQMKKVELARKAMERYQDNINEINARNAAFKQNVALQTLAAQQRLEEARQKGELLSQQFRVDISNPDVIQQFPNLPGFSISGTPYYKEQPIAGGKFTYTVPKKKEKEELITE